MKVSSKMIKRARALISDPEHWTQEVYAIDALGNEVGSNDGEAVAFCSWGALYRTAGINENEDPEWEKAVSFTFKPVIGCCCLADFNDGRRHSEVLAAFDEVIARLEATEKEFEEGEPLEPIEEQPVETPTLVAV